MKRGSAIKADERDNHNQSFQSNNNNIQGNLSKLLIQEDEAETFDALIDQLELIQKRKEFSSRDSNDDNDNNKMKIEIKPRNITNNSISPNLLQNIPLKCISDIDSNISSETEMTTGECTPSREFIKNEKNFLFNASYFNSSGQNEKNLSADSSNEKKEKKVIPEGKENQAEKTEDNSNAPVRRSDFLSSDSNKENLEKDREEEMKLEYKKLERIKKMREENTIYVENYEEFKQALDDGKFVMAHRDGTAETEALIKEECKAVTRCIPIANFLHDQQA